MKPRSIKAEYKAMLSEVEHPFCWNCGRGPEHRPEWFYNDWFMHRAHIVARPRIEDRRCVAILCHLCHFGAQAGERFQFWLRPRLTLAHLLWIKSKFDPEFYDRAFMQRFSVRILPRAAKPPKIFLQEYAQRRG